LLLAPSADARTCIPGKDVPLEQTIATLSGLIADMGMKIEIASWRNIVPNVWSLHLRDAHSQMFFTNGKGATKESALASAPVDLIKRLNRHFCYNATHWGPGLDKADLEQYTEGHWLQPRPDGELPEATHLDHCLTIYHP